MNKEPHTDNVWGADEFTTWLTASCRRQGISLIVADPTVIAHVAALLGHTNTAGAVAPRSCRRTSDRIPPTGQPAIADPVSGLGSIDVAA